MTQFSLADESMVVVDADALAPNDLKAPSPQPVECAPQDNQIEAGESPLPLDEASNQCEVEAATDAMDTTDAIDTTAPEAAAAPASKKDCRVAFSTADVVEFEPTLWTATVASDGVPVGLSSTVRRRTRRRLDSLESERLLHRVNRQEYMEHGYLEPEERVDMLEAAGHSLALMSHVERESMRVNRERWESNEYDLLYQFGLGEEAIMDLDEEDERLLSQGALLGFHQQQHEEEEQEEVNEHAVVVDDEDDEMLEAEDDDEGNPAEYYFYSNRATVQTDPQVGFSMDDMDSYDTRKYEEWAWDYNTADCILGDDSDTYSKDGSYDLPSLDFGLPEMSSSPTDVAGSGESLIVSCGKVVGVGSPSPSTASVGKASSPRLFV